MEMSGSECPDPVSKKNIVIDSVAVGYSFDKH